jgi:hypothetical protein
MRVVRWRSASLVLACVLTRAAPTLAESSACEPDTAARLAFIEDRLERRRAYAGWWWKGWSAFYGVGTAVQAYRAGHENDDGKQADLVVSAVKAAVGTAALLLRSPTARRGADPLRAIEPTSPERCRARLARAEELLRESARESGRRRSWKAHAVQVLVNAVGGVIVAEGWDERTRGWRSAGIGIAVGEASILTYPWKADEDLQAYERRFGRPVAASKPTWHLSAWGRGARVMIRF